VVKLSSAELDGVEWIAELLSDVKLDEEPDRQKLVVASLSFAEQGEDALRHFMLFGSTAGGRQVGNFRGELVCNCVSFGNSDTVGDVKVKEPFRLWLRLKAEDGVWKPKMTSHKNPQAISEKTWLW
jgi:hypothetical protein